MKPSCNTTGILGGVSLMVSWFKGSYSLGFILMNCHVCNAFYVKFLLYDNKKCGLITTETTDHQGPKWHRS